MKEIKEELKEQFGANLMFDADNEPNRYMFDEKELDVFIDEVVKKLGLHIVSQHRELLENFADWMDKNVNFDGIRQNEIDSYLKEKEIL